MDWFGRGRTSALDQHRRHIVRRPPVQGDIQQAAAAGARLSPMDHLVQDLLLRDHIAQPVAAQQQEVSRFQLLPEQIGPQLRVGAQARVIRFLWGWFWPGQG